MLCVISSQKNIRTKITYVMVLFKHNENIRVKKEHSDTSSILCWCHLAWERLLFSHHEKVVFSPLIK